MACILVLAMLLLSSLLSLHHTAPDDSPILGLPIEAIKPDAIVARDFSGTDASITAAVARAVAAPAGRFVIYIKAGVYEEHVFINQPDVVLISDGADKTIITGRRCNRTGQSMPDSATVTVLGPGFLARDLMIQNTAGAVLDKQAVAFRSESERSVVFRCHIQGFQDTLLVESHVQFYRDCTISGTVDFVFGDGTVVFQNCLLLVRRPADVHQYNVITAQGRGRANSRDRPSHTGFSFLNCTITAAPGENLTGVETYLGRPWRPFSLVVFMLCSIDGVVHADGWVPWKKGLVNHTIESTLVYREFKNHGLGADLTRRVEWRGFRVLKSDKQAEVYTVARFINGSEWLPRTGVEYYLGLYG